ncbi:MAG TPA: O-antigen ligase family protein [Melioribacteraceae bacterium]|nr:O-antigen ligase family protein [Melioribacteraceae bacterium]
MNIFNKNNLLDKIIFVFIVIFLVTLTNSIFLNQIGYYGALILLLYKFYATKQNPFTKNGLEIPIILFIVAEIISALLSEYKSAAFTNVLKRVLLLPILYVLPAIVNSEYKAKLVFKIFIGTALVMIVGYLGIVYNYYINNMYAVNGVGPTFLKIVMTTGGILSFITIILFAYFINEKANLKNKIVYFILFGLSALALAANYSRAAWLGAFFGIITVLLIKRKWLLLLIPIVLVTGYLFVNKNQSNVNTYVIDDNKITLIKSVNTKGRAGTIANMSDNQIIVSDYETGIFNLKKKNYFDTNSPVFRVDKWTDSVFSVHLINSNNCVYKINKYGEIKKLGEFVTTGLTRNIKAINNKLYIADVDSGLTVLNNPYNLKEKIELQEINNFLVFDVDTNYFVYYNSQARKIIILNNKNGIPKDTIYSENINTMKAAILINGNSIYLQEDNGLITYSIDSLNAVKKEINKTIKGVIQFFIAKNIVYGLTEAGDVYAINSDNNKVKLLTGKVKYIPVGTIPLIYSGIAVSNDTVYIASHKRNRLYSIIDPYHISNYARMNLWRIGIKILEDYTVFGVGDVDLIPYYKKYKSTFEKEEFGHLHNNYIHLLAILGIFGFVIVMFLFYKVAIINYKIYLEAKTIPIISSIALGVTSAFIGFLFSGLAEWNFGDHEIITFVWFLTGLNIACGNFYKKAE